MQFQGKQNEVEQNYSFQIDLKAFLVILSKVQQKVFSLRIEGFVLKEVAKKLKMSLSRVLEMLNDIKKKFIKYFGL